MMGCSRSVDGAENLESGDKLSYDRQTWGNRFYSVRSPSGNSISPDRKISGFVLGVMGNGIYRSTNGGTNWVHLTAHLTLPHSRQL
jgi:hypothetical protein